MAKSSGLKGFYPQRNMNSDENVAVQELIIANSTQVSIGDAIDITTDPGFAQAATATSKVAGVVVGIVNVNGINVFTSNATISGINGTKSGDDTYTSSSTNKTVDQCKVQVVYTTPDQLFYNEADSTLTTVELGTYFALTATGDQVTGTGDSTARTCQLVEIISLAGGPNLNGEGLFRFSRSHWTNIA